MQFKTIYGFCPNNEECPMGTVTCVIRVSASSRDGEEEPPYSCPRCRGPLTRYTLPPDSPTLERLRAFAKARGLKTFLTGSA